MAFVSTTPRWPCIKTISQAMKQPSKQSVASCFERIGRTQKKGKIIKGKVHVKQPIIGSSQVEKAKQKQQQFRKNLASSLTSRIVKNRPQIKTSSNKFRLSNYEKTKDKFSTIQGNNKFFQVTRVKGLYVSEPAERNSPSMHINQKQHSLTAQNFQIKKTRASINKTHSQNFYIGSKDQHNLRKKKSSKNSKNDSNGIYSTSKQKSKMKQKMIKRENENQEFNNSLISINHQNFISVSQLNTSKKKKTKPLSSKHPFKHNKYHQQIFADEKTKFEQKQTVIGSQQSTQFIQNAFPGPGTYEYYTKSQTTKKSLMFTDINKQRFQLKDISNRFSHQFYQIKSANTRKVQSRACQSRVGFGTCIKNANFENFTKQDNQKQNEQTNGISHNIQYNSLKIKLKDALNPGFFMSKAPRFTAQRFNIKSQTNKKKFFLTTKDEMKYQAKISKLRKDIQNNKLNYYFNYSDKDILQAVPLTANIEFLGQEHHTIQQKIRKMNLKNVCDFDCKEQCQNNREQVAINMLDQQKKLKSEIQIKHQLLEDMYGYRQRQKLVSNNQIKSYTFNKSQIQRQKKNVSPSPTEYYKEAQWIKGSFNVKYMSCQNNVQTVKQIESSINKSLLVKQIKI